MSTPVPLRKTSKKFAKKIRNATRAETAETTSGLGKKFNPRIFNLICQSERNFEGIKKVSAYVAAVATGILRSCC